MRRYPEEKGEGGNELKNVRLADRQRGSEFSRFERKLIFDPSFAHIGYVKYISADRFILKKSFFTEIDTGRIYRLPVEMGIRPDEGSFIEVDPDSIHKEINLARKRGFGPSSAGMRSIIDVGNFQEANVPLPSPNLPVDEFLQRASILWDNAEDDLLDHVIGLTIVSAPFSVYGKGGLGSEGMEVTGRKGSGGPREVSASIMSNLPVEFRTSGSSHYRYSSIDSLRSMFQMEKAGVREDCYSILKPRRMKEAMRGSGPPIQLPFLINESRFKKREAEFDIDVLDYQLTALYMPPPPESIVEDLAQKTVRSAHNEAFFDMPGIGEPDPLAAVKLGLAVSRLHIGKQFTGRGYSRTRTEPSRGRQILDDLLKKGLENIRERIMEEEVLSKERSHPWVKRLKPLDKRIFYHLRSAFEENGIQETPIDSVAPDIDRILVQESLERLNRYGYVLFMKGGTMIKVVISSNLDGD